MSIQHRSLVLNQNYEPLNVCSVKRAFLLVFSGKAEVLEIGEEPIYGVGNAEYETPSVIRLQYFVRRPTPQRRLSRREVFVRDAHTCQYCGRHSNLTLDHVIPRHKGGPHTWDNLTTACQKCNHQKGGRTPQEAKMPLITKPRRPSVNPAELFLMHLKNYSEWEPFLTGWIKKEDREMKYAS